MSILSWLDQPFNVKNTVLGVENTVMTIDDVVNRKSDTMTPYLAMNIETVFACATDLGRTLSQLPLVLYRKSGNRDFDIDTSPRDVRIFTKRPNDYQNMSDFANMCGVSVALNGAFYAYIERNSLGNPMALIPFVYQRNVIPQMDIRGNVYYMYVRNDGTIGDPYRQEDLFIVKGSTLDGFTPVSPIEYNAKLLNLSKEQDENYRESVNKGVTSQMAMVTDNVFNDENAINRLKEDLKKLRGVKGLSEVPVFENGVKPFSLKLTPAETNYLENSKLTEARLCKIMNTPPHRIGSYPFTSMAKGVLSELDEYYMRNTVNPVLVAFEQEMNKLVPSNKKVVFNRRSFYSGSPSTMIETVDKELKAGVTMINEGRIDIGRDPVDGGDVFVTESNNASYGTWVELANRQPSESENNA